MISAENRLLDHIAALGVHGGRRNPAPHKPLLVAVVASLRCADPLGPRLLEYSTIAGPMASLLRAAGRTPRPWYPFVRMGTEPFWELTGSFERNGSGDVANVKDLSRPDVKGGFVAEFDGVVCDPRSAGRVIDATCRTWLKPEIAATAIALLRPAAGAVAT